MILACPNCSRQYKVDKYPPGQHVRCLCGHDMTVPAPVAHDARILHCADCGGPLPPDAVQCEYCGGVLDPKQRNYTLVCPKCFARLPESARFCIECATPIRPQEVVERRRSRRLCPRCAEPLQSRLMDSIGFDECPKCTGIWLSNEEFKAITELKVEEFHANPLPEAKRGTLKAEPVAYVKCPVCRNMMNRENFGRASGVIIDKCKNHGVWLDATELERIAWFIAEGGLARARAKEAEDLEWRARQAELRSSAPQGSVLLTPVQPGEFSFVRVLSRLLE